MNSASNTYSEIAAIMGPRLIFVQKALVLFFSGEPILGGAYYRREFCVSKWVGLDTMVGC